MPTPPVTFSQRLAWLPLFCAALPSFAQGPVLTDKSFTTPVPYDKNWMTWYNHRTDMTDRYFIDLNGPGVDNWKSNEFVLQAIDREQHQLTGTVRIPMP